jgi:hypothetical protein
MRLPRIPRFRHLLAAAGVVFVVAAALCLRIHVRNSVYLLRATDAIFAAPGSDEAHAIALAHFVAERADNPVDPDSATFTARLEHSLPFELSPVTVLKEGFAFPNARRYGPCGQLCRTVRAVGELRGIHTRKVLMGTGRLEHAMVAIEVDGGFRLFDPTFDFYWRNASGHVATIEEVRADTAIFAQVYRRYPNYPYRLDDAMYLNWRRLGRAGLWLRRGLEIVLGRERVEQFDTPMLYDRPWLGYAWCCFTLAVACLAASLLLTVRARRAAHPVLAAAC